MGRFTELTDGDVRALAAALELGSVRGWRPIDAGTINSNFALETDRGRFFLRINEGKREQDVRYEAELVAALAARGVSTPLPVRAVDGRPYAPFGDRFASAFPWVDGEHRDLGQVAADDTRRVGRELARLHRAGAGLGPEYRRDGIYTTALIAERYRGFRADPDPVLAPAIAAIGDELAWLQSRAAARETGTQGIIHGDLFRDNVLFGAGGVSSPTVTLIDFEQASWGSWAYDLAVTLCAWCYTDDFQPQLVAGLVAGYAEVAPAPAPELLWIEARAAAMRFTVTRITDVYLARTGQEDKDFRRYLARLERLRAAGSNGFAAWLASM